MPEGKTTSGHGAKGKLSNYPHCDRQENTEGTFLRAISVRVKLKINFLYPELI
jgi:hypothetical protein